MKENVYLVLLLGIMLPTGCQQPINSANSDISKVDSDHVTKIVDQVVDASCGQCQFDMPGDGCDLALRIDGHTYYVDGSSIDDHGDAHGADGLCNCIRRARISGEITQGRFAATSIELLPQENDGGQ